jgi:hypothetical protein
MKKIISIMLCIMLSVSMMTACGSKESDNDKKDVGSETKQDVFTYDLKGVTVAMNENMEPLVKNLGMQIITLNLIPVLFRERIRYILMEVLR